jgi:hypothetical protein
MEAQTLIVLLNFSPDNIKRNHPFWNKILEAGINIEQKNIKFKRWERKFEYLKTNWRSHKHIIFDFYHYLRLYFPNAIPFSLFFPCKLSLANRDHYEYIGAEFFDSIVNLDDSIHFPEYDDNFIYHDFNQKRMLIDLADKWLNDILSGESFYERNKDYFTRTEIKPFLTCDWVEPDIRLVRQSSYMNLLQHYWETKINVNEVELPSNFFVNKFNFIDRYVQEYFRFICRNKRHIRDENEISNIWDYLNDRRNRAEFDFNYMTWQQLRHLSEEWHEQRNNQQFGYAPKKLEEMKNEIWKKMKIKDFTHTVDEKTWTITEITTGKLLYEEGDDMHNCVFSYIDQCISGHCAIFSVKVNDKRMATLEINKFNSKYNLVQARGKMNSVVDKEIKSIITIWAKKNNIKLNDYVFK